jgi:hypothetical protein
MEKSLVEENMRQGKDLGENERQSHVAKTSLEGLQDVFLWERREGGVMFGLLGH